MLSTNHNDHNPTWLDVEGNGERKDETSALLGSGAIDLTDGDGADEVFGPSSKVTYGAGVSPDDDSPFGEGDKKKDGDPLAGDGDGDDKKKKKKKNTDDEIGPPEMPRPNCLLAIFFFLEACGILASLALLVTQLIPLFVVSVRTLGVVAFILKVHIIIFCLLFVAVETSLPLSFLTNSGFLQNYFSRGFLYSFVGLSCVEEAYSEHMSDILSHSQYSSKTAWLEIFIDVSAWAIIALGAMYVLLGICCLKGVRDRMRAEHKEQWGEYRKERKLYKQRNQKSLAW
mmetsp:Transcript_14902/g.41279  ORF Transcript_14902/g.41279 Transcript_14902/m.41279 type:complete len:285 (-) Transcript_14902:432-1286(-)|eukprot:CAMPEP_0198116486 /NCGR_PEP_ID=MMETSP1442-20131203/12806_1 /TAXON_ID= /ORGANISM="Craspedostauros australis, Strain CCMP3328" /LENGTH=284 /DNA_ID=CAMNT_0043774319 /DNA_START=250 /DNA_END=1104 /DNA_ORIENTATION=-